MPVKKFWLYSFLILIVFLNCKTNECFAQGENPAEKYLHVYKQFLGAGCPLESDDIKHFVYFARDREAVRNHPFLQITRFEGAQIMYPWKLLEPEKGKYDFSLISEDYLYLKNHGKKLFIQLQDATFNPDYIGVPEYLLTKEYNYGAIYQYNDDGKPEGWVARRWNKKVQQRFALLLEALGKEFDGKIEGINLQESAIGVSKNMDSTFSPQIYVLALKVNMMALRRAFPNSTTMQYANFMPGEWLPWEDLGYLRSIYKYGEKIGVGLGAPDLMVNRKGQLNHALAMMHENKFSVPLGIAIQDGNYVGKTGADEDYHESEVSENLNKPSLVPLLHAFAKNFLQIDYMFWVNQEPYFTQQVIPCFEK